MQWLIICPSNKCPELARQQNAKEVPETDATDEAADDDGPDDGPDGDPDGGLDDEVAE